MKLSLVLLTVTLVSVSLLSSGAEYNTNYEEDDYSDDYDKNSTLVSTATTDNIYTESDYDDDYNSENQDYDDYKDYADSTESETDASAATQPYSCPLQCKCEFKRQGVTSSLSSDDDYDEDELYDYDKESVKLKKTRQRRRREAVLVTASKYSSETKATAYKSDNYQRRSTEPTRYAISVNCASQGLYTIADLFDYDFPLDQVISL